MMKQCILADFEWCVTPHPHGGRFQYFNEILSAAAVRIDEAGCVLDTYYTLIRPEDPGYVHPVILASLKLDRAALAAAPTFGEFFERFCAFVTADPTYVSPVMAPVCTWGAADRAALLQNLRTKGGYTAEDAPHALPLMRDLQPSLCRAAELRQPYPSLASLLHTLHLDTQSDNRHNALSDAMDTARIAAYFMSRDETRAAVAPLFFSPELPLIPPIREDINGDMTAPPAAQPQTALRRAKKERILCPVCSRPIGCGTWFPVSETELLSLCSCETDGKFLCSLRAEAAPNGAPAVTVRRELLPYLDAQKTRYAHARRAAREQRRM